MAPAIGKGRFQGLLDVDISTPCGGFGAEELTNDPLRPTDTTGCGAEDSIGYFWCEYSPPRLSALELWRDQAWIQAFAAASTGKGTVACGCLSIAKLTRCHTMSELPSVGRPDLLRRYCNGKTVTHSAF